MPGIFDPSIFDAAIFDVDAGTTVVVMVPQSARWTVLDGRRAVAMFDGRRPSRALDGRRAVAMLEE